MRKVILALFVIMSFSDVSYAEESIAPKAALSSMKEDATGFSECHGASIAGLEMMEDELEMENTRKIAQDRASIFMFSAITAFNLSGEKDVEDAVSRISDKTKTMILSEYEIFKKSGIPMEESMKHAEKCKQLAGKAYYLYEEFAIKDCVSSNSCFSGLE